MTTQRTLAVSDYVFTVLLYERLEGFQALPALAHANSPPSAVEQPKRNRGGRGPAQSTRNVELYVTHATRLLLLVPLLGHGPGGSSIIISFYKLSSFVLFTHRRSCASMGACAPPPRLCRRVAEAVVLAWVQQLSSAAHAPAAVV